MGWFARLPRSKKVVGYNAGGRGLFYLEFVCSPVFTWVSVLWVGVGPRVVGAAPSAVGDGLNAESSISFGINIK